MRKFLKKTIFVLLSVICFLASILFIAWWQMSTYIPPNKLNSAKSIDQVLFEFKLNGKYGCINKYGETIVQPKFDDINCSEDMIIPVEINKKWGFVNQAGEFVLEPQFILPRAGGYSNYFSEGLAVVCINQKCGFIDSSGNYVIEPKFDFAENFSEGYALVQIGSSNILGFSFGNSKTALINNIGEIVFDKMGYVFESGFSDGLARVTINEKTGFIDKDGNLVIPPQDLRITDFNENLAVFSTQVYRFGYVDKTGKIVIPQQFKQASQFSEGLASVMFENGKYGFIDKTGKTVIEPQFDMAEPFYEDRSVVSIGTRKGFIDKTGETVIPIKFGWAERFVNGLARVGLEDENNPTRNKKYGYIDKIGNFILQPRN